MKLPNYLLYIGLFFYCIESGYSQHQELQEKPKIWQSDNKPSTDTTTLLSAFKSGEIHGHFRYYFSNTINEGSLTDYHANAIGGGLRYESGAFHGFNVGVSGFYIFDAGSSDLAAKDNITGQNNRYEIGLFDVTNPENLNEINRLEEFFIKYNRGKTKITFGRQLLNTPFINLQDGRMRPTAAEGLWIEKVIDKNHQFQLGWLYSIAPRSTSKWYNAGESIGLYPAGVDPNGIKSNYTGNTKTKGILLVNYQTKFFKPLTINFWNMWVENVMNTTMLQIDWEHKIMHGKVYASIQGASQVKSGNGGNEDVTKAYFTNEKAVYTFGSKVGWKKNKWDVNINFNRITAGGRYHMPREWGRDYFFTFIPRERNEGFGDLTGIVLKSSYQPFKSTTVQLAAGTFILPDVKNFALNKYGIPSYHHLNVDIRHKFSGLLNGLEAQVLWVTKLNNGEIYDNQRFVFNKVDMHLLNVVFNFRF